MVFRSPCAVTSKLPEISNVSLWDFMLDENYGRTPLSKSLPPYICGLSGRKVRVMDQAKDAELLARSLLQELGLVVNGSENLDKVICIYAQNTVDIMTLNLAIHRINGISAPMSAAFVATELQSQLQLLKPKALFCTPALLGTAIKAAEACNFPKSRIFVCEMPGSNAMPSDFKTLSQLITDGALQPAADPILWAPEQAKRQIAFICGSSGTSGLPKQVMISHYNVAANITQLVMFEQEGRLSPTDSEVVLGFLPHSHIYGIVVIAYLSFYRGDSVVTLPAFNMDMLLKCTQEYQINTWNLVPTVISEIAQNPSRLLGIDLSSVRAIVSGGAALGKATVASMAKNFPDWVIRQAYGATEAAACISHTSLHDPWIGSCGSLLPGVEAKLVDANGREIHEYEQPGELLVKSPSIALGYLGNAVATHETFMTDADGRWLRTGDIVEMRLSATDTEHLFITDRVKDMIKVKGYQVAPAELEACLLNSPFVHDCAVIGVPDERAGEMPQAFIQKSSAGNAKPDAWLVHNLQQRVKRDLARFKWLRGIEFIDSIPRSPSNKILRRELRNRVTNMAAGNIKSKM